MNIENGMQQLCRAKTLPDVWTQADEGGNRMSEHMIIELWLKNTALPRTYKAANTFEEGSMFCVQVEGKIYKYPIADIFRIVQCVVRCREDKQ